MKIKQKNSAFARGWSAFYWQAGKEMSKVSIFHSFVFVLINTRHRPNKYILPVVSWMLLLQMSLRLKKQGNIF